MDAFRWVGLDCLRGGRKWGAADFLGKGVECGAGIWYNIRHEE